MRPEPAFRPSAAMRFGRVAMLLGAAVLAWWPGETRAAAPAPVGAAHGMVVSAQRLASQVGVDVLKEGGNAVDAAVAVGYALAVVYPAAGNLGGGGFMTVRFADGRATFLDFREKAPQAATPTMFLGPDGHVVPGRSTASWLAVGVPGTVAGLEQARQRYGTLARERLIAPALALARDGFVLTDGDAQMLRIAQGDLARDPAAAAIFVKSSGAPWAAGDRLVQPQLAATLAAISRDGEAAVYGGAVGRTIAAASRAGGGVFADADFTAYRVRELPPVACTYCGYTVQSAAPPSSGGTTLCEILNVLQGYDLEGMGFHSAAEIHAMAGAMVAAYHDRNTLLGDPDFVRNPLAHLLDTGYADQIRAAIPVLGAVAPAPASAAAAEAPQTTHYSIADAAGSAVSVTTTLNGWFGARRVAGDTGILMNNEMDDFTTGAGHANMFGLVQGDNNAIAPGKTPLSSMAPTVVSRDGHLVLVIGTPGGSRIITTVAEILVNLVDHGMTLSEAIDAPRIHVQGFDAIDAEPFAISPDTRRLLVAAGHAVKESQPWGMAAGILVNDKPALRQPVTQGHALALPDVTDTTFRFYGAEDVRGETGTALGY